VTNIPKELRQQAIKEMVASFGFEAGVDANFDETVRMAEKVHARFLQNQPTPVNSAPIPLDLMPERRERRLQRQAEFDIMRQNTHEETRRALAANHERGLINIFSMDNRISVPTAMKLVEYITGERS